MSDLKWVRILGLVFIPLLASISIAKWAFLLPANFGLPLEWLAYYPAKIPLFILYNNITEAMRLAVIGGSWIAVVIGIYYCRKILRTVLPVVGKDAAAARHAVNNRNRLWGCLIRSFAIFIVMLFAFGIWVSEGMGFIPSYPGLANVSAMSGISYPPGTTLLYSEFNGGLQDRQLSAQLGMRSDEIPALLRSLPSSFQIVHLKTPPDSDLRMTGKPLELSWDHHNGGEGIMAERKITSSEHYAQLIVTTYDAQSSMSEVYIYCLM